MEVWPDLFGRALLLRQWGRIGTEGRPRLDPHSDPGAAINALARLAQGGSAAAASTAPGWCRLHCSRRSTWCMTFVSCRGDASIAARMW